MIALHSMFCYKFPIYCVNKNAFEVLWKAVITPDDGGNYGFSGPGHWHCIEMIPREKSVVVFGAALEALYVVVLNSENGKQLFRFVHGEQSNVASKDDLNRRRDFEDLSEITMTPTTAFRRWQTVSWIGLVFPFFCSCCGFQPSWAKGWPGLSQTTVFGSFFALVTFLGVFSIGGVLSLNFTHRQTPETIRWSHFYTFLILTLMAGLVLSALAFWYVDAAPEFQKSSSL